MVFPRIRSSALALVYSYIIDLNQASVNEILLCSEIRENDTRNTSCNYPLPQCYRSLALKGLNLATI